MASGTAVPLARSRRFRSSPIQRRRIDDGRCFVEAKLLHVKKNQIAVYLAASLLILRRLFGGFVVYLAECTVYSAEVAVYLAPFWQSCRLFGGVAVYLASVVYSAENVFLCC